MKYEGYNLCGLKVNSSFRFKRQKAKAAYKKADVELELGKIEKIPAGLEDTVYTSFRTFNKNFYIQNIPSIAKFAIYNKRKVVIEPYRPVKVHAVEYYFLETILPILLICNDYFPINASAVYNGQDIHLFTSKRGNGKSILAASLCYTHNNKFISDNICLLKWDEANQEFLTRCIDPNVCLWSNTFSLFNEKIKKYKPKKVRQGIHKYYLNFNAHAYKKYAKVKAIHFINEINDKVDISCTEIKGFKKIEMSKNIIHSSDIAQTVSKDQHLFKYSGLIAQHLNISRIKRSKLTKVIDFANYINDEILTKSIK